MNYLALIWADGRPAREDLAVMQRELPAFGEEMDRRGVRLFGRELELPQQAATVRVRDGETIVTDGPFAETKSSSPASTCCTAQVRRRRSSSP